VSREAGSAWLIRPRSQRSRSDEELGVKVRASFLASGRTYGARRVWRDLLTEGMSCGLHRIERLMRLQALKARPRRRRRPPDLGERPATAVAANVLNRTFEASAPNRKWICGLHICLDDRRLALRRRRHRSVLPAGCRLVDERSDDGTAR
jgi:putative transposase